MCFSAAFLRGGGELYFLMAKCLTRRIRRRRVDELRNKFALGKLGQAAKPVVFSDTIRAACKREVQTNYSTAFAACAERQVFRVLSSWTRFGSLQKNRHRRKRRLSLAASKKLSNDIKGLSNTSKKSLTQFSAIKKRPAYERRDLNPHA